MNEEISLELPSEHNVEAAYEKHRDEEILHECIRDMAEPDRSIFIYRYFYGFKIKQIAKIIKLSQKKIENTLFRGKEKLRTALIKGGISRDI